MKKRIFALMMSILLITISASGAFATDTAADETGDISGTHTITYQMLSEGKDGYTLDNGTGSYVFNEVARSDKYSISYEEQMYIVCVTDLESGNRWYTSPPVAPKSLPSSIATDAMSPIIVNYTKKGTAAVAAANSYTNSLKADGAKVTKLANGIRFDYDFPNYKFSVPVQFTVDNEGFVAEILFSEIKEYGANTVVSVDFLKYFGAAIEGTEGYMVVPDGAGAIINYDNGKDQAELQYSKDFYGIDQSTVTDDTITSSRSEVVTLPMFGVVQAPVDYQKPSISQTINYNDVQDKYAKGEEVVLPNFAIVEKQDVVREAKDALDKAQKELDRINNAIDNANKSVADAQTALSEAKANAANPELSDKDAEKAQKEVTKAEEKLEKAKADADKTITDQMAKRPEAQTKVNEAQAAVAAAEAELKAVEEQVAAQEPSTDDEAPVSYVGFLAEVENGAEIATLKANVSGLKGTNRYNNFNNIYTSATYRVTYSVRLKGQISSSTNVIYNAQDPVSIPTYTIRYRFINEDASYVKIASMYRDVLIKRGWLTENGDVSDRFYVEFYGAVNKKKSFAGLVYNARETLTSFNEADAILKELSGANVTNVHAMYTNFSDDYFDRNIQINLEASGSLGGDKDLAALIQSAQGMKASVALGANFVALPSGGNGFSTFFDVADVINISPIKVYPVSLASNTRDTSKKPYYLLKAEVYAEAVDQLIAAANANNYTSLYFNEEALQLYSDLAPGGYQADRAAEEMVKAFEKLAAANVELTMSNPNAYLFKYADYLTDIPVCSSKEILFDAEIPLLQMILRGSKNFGGESMNITDVSDEAFLRHLAYGTDMKYSLINASSESLLKTDHTFLYSATFTSFKEQIADRYAAFVELDAAVDNSAIVDYRFDLVEDGTVTATVYENGVTVYVNYGSAEYTTDGGDAVQAMSYKIVKGGEGA